MVSLGHRSIQTLRLGGWLLILLWGGGCGRFGFASHATDAAEVDGGLDGGASLPDGTVILPDGAAVLPDGNVVPADSGEAPVDGAVLDGGARVDAGLDGSLDAGPDGGVLVCGAPLPAGDMLRGLAEAWCRGLSSVGIVGPEILLGEDLAACADLLVLVMASPEYGVEALVDAITTGAVVYDPTAAADCFCDLSVSAGVSGAAGPLDPLFLGGGGCPAAFQGTVDTGGACVMDLECRGDRVCESGGTCGTCQPRRPTGASCTRSAQCQRGADFSALCLTDTCVELRSVEVGLGQPCLAPDVAGDLATIGQCAAGLACDIISGGCVAIPPLGAPCTTVCGAGQLCLDSVCTALVVADVGEPCDAVPGSGSARICDEYRGLTCNAVGVCECPSGTCTTMPGLGASCAELQTCGATAYCETTTEVCAPRRTDGASCSSPSQCLSGACDTGMCAAYCSSTAVGS